MIRSGSIHALDDILRSVSPAGEPAVPQRLEQLEHGRSAGCDPPVGPDEVPGGEPLRLGQRPEQRRGRLVRQGQEPDSTAPVGGRDDTRREAAEPSAGVVEHDRSRQRVHGRIVPGSTVPRLTRCPM
jgi:hypothetical protein